MRRLKACCSALHIWHYLEETKGQEKGEGLGLSFITFSKKNRGIKVESKKMEGQFLTPKRLTFGDEFSKKWL